MDFLLPLSFNYISKGNEEWRLTNRLTSNHVQFKDDHCTFLLTFWLPSLVDRTHCQVHWIVLKTWLPSPQELGFLFLQVLWGDTACQSGQELANSRTLVEMPKPCVRMQLKYLDTTYIHQRHLSTSQIFLPAWCAVKRCDAHHGQGLERADCWDSGHTSVHSCVYLTGHITSWIWWWWRSVLQSSDKTSMTLNVEETLEATEDLLQLKWTEFWTDQLEMHFA